MRVRAVVRRAHLRSRFRMRDQLRIVRRWADVQRVGGMRPAGFLPGWRDLLRPRFVQFHDGRVHMQSGVRQQRVRRVRERICRLPDLCAGCPSGDTDTAERGLPGGVGVELHDVGSRLWCH